MSQPELTREQAEAIRAALPTALAPPDRGRLLALADAARRGLDDDLFADPRVRASAELSLQAILLRAGIEERPETPQTVATRQHSASFGLSANPAAAEIERQRSIAADPDTPESAKALAASFVERNEAAWTKYLTARDRTKP